MAPKAPGRSRADASGGGGADGVGLGEADGDAEADGDGGEEAGGSYGTTAAVASAIIPSQRRAEPRQRSPMVARLKGS